MQERRDIDPPNQPLLAVQDLHVRYGRREAGDRAVHAVRGVSFQIDPGEAVGVLGESGCGKTSLLRALAGLLPADAAVDGAADFGKGDEERDRRLPLLELGADAWRSVHGDRIGVVYQQPTQALSPYRRVGLQIADVVRSHRSWGRQEVWGRVHELLAEVGLEPDVAAAHPHQLSGGQLQRIVLCQALACEPELLLADEPTASLDADVETRILDLVTALRRRRDLALLWISHDPSVLERVSERLLVMHDGRLLEQGATADVLRAPRHDFTRELLACRPGAG